MGKKIIKVEEVPEEKKEKFQKAKSVGKTILKVAGGILLSVLAFYGILILNPNLGRVTKF